MNRSANYAIKGYIYQFYKTIEQILSSADNVEITVEGIEDIDLSTTNTTNLIQCKYHEARRFSPSVVYKPVGLMLKHSIENESRVSIYTIYAYFRENSPETRDWITNNFLQKALEHVDQKITASDQEIESFKRKLQFKVGMKYKLLEEDVKTKLQSVFNCSTEDVELYYCNNAIAHIVKLATQSDINKRCIKKCDFKKAIDKKNFLFDIWQYQLKGKKAYINTIKKQMRSTTALANTKRKFPFISRELAKNITPEMNLNIFLHNLITQYNIVGKLYNSELWTVIIDGNSSLINKAKIYLIENEIYFNDGYESLSFCGEYFNTMPIKNKNKGDKIKITSHHVRLISAKTFKENTRFIIDSNKQPHIFIDTTRDLKENQKIFDNLNTGFYHLSALNSLEELNEILKSGR